MFIRRKLSVATILLLALVGSACSSNSSTKQGNQSASASVPAQDLAADQTLRFQTAFAAQPRSFDPGQQQQALLPRMYSEALLKVRADAQDVEGAAAESYGVSADGLTYTFNLRKDGRYNDGQPVKAQDFVFAWQRLLDPRKAAPANSTFASVVKGGTDPGLRGDDAAADAAVANLGLKAVDDSTFQVVLSHISPDFKYVATLVDGAPLRRDAVERFGADWATKPEALVTNGMFEVSKVVPAQVVELVPNPNYRQQPMLKKIVVSQSDATAAWNQYLSDQTDVAFPPGPSLDAAQKDPNLSKDIVKFNIPSLTWVSFNTTKPPFDNPKVRLAFAQSIDRAALTTTVFPGATTPRASLIPDGTVGYNPDLEKTQSFDPTAAKATLASSGVPKTQIDGVDELSSSFSPSISEFIHDQLQKNLAVNSKIDPAGDSASLNAKLKQGDFQFYDFDFHNGRFPDPKDYFDLFLSDSPQNTPRWNNADYDRLVREADATLDSSKRLSLYKQAEGIFLQAAPVAVLYQTTRLTWVKPWVGGITTNPYDDAALPGSLEIGKMFIKKH